MFQNWNGKPFERRQFAFQIVETRDSDTPLAAAYDGVSGVLLTAPVVGVFLLEHVGCELLVHDASSVHWNLYRILTSPRQPEALEALWSFSKRCLLVDIMLLEQRLRLVLERCYAMPKPLHRLRNDYCGEESAIPSTGSGSDGVCGEVEAIFQVYRAILSNEAYSWVAKLPVSQSGPLGIGFDAQGAIAATQPSSGLAIEHATRRQIIETCEKHYAAASRELYDDKLARNCFHWDGLAVARDKKGYPCQDTKLLRKRLAETLNQLRDWHGRPFMLPRDDQGQASLVPENWAPFDTCVPRLRAWAELNDSAALIRYFRKCDQGSFRPKYRIVPDLWAFEPRLSRLRCFGFSEWRPVHGYCCQVTLKNLELRCLAVTLDRYTQESRLSLSLQDERQFGELEDVHETLAREVRDLFLYDEPRHQGLPPEERDFWIKLIEVMLFAIPRGLASQQIRFLVNEQVRKKELSSRDFERLHQIFLRVLRDFDIMLKPSTVDDVCRHMEVDSMMFYQEVDSRGIPLHTAEAAMLNFVFGWTNAERIRDALLTVLPSSSRFRNRIKEDSLSPLDPQLLWDFPNTPAGQWGLPAFGSQSRSIEFQQRADEVIKRVAYELVAGGFEVCAIDGNDLILRLEEDEKKTCQKIASVIESAAESVVPGAHFEIHMSVSKRQG